MRGWWIPVLVVLAGCSDDDNNGTGPGMPPDTPASLSSTSLDGAVALTWTDNSYQSDPAPLFQLPGLQHRRTTSTTTSAARAGASRARPWHRSSSWARLPMASPGAFHVTAVSVDGFESGRSPLRADTPRPDSRNVAVATVQSDVTAGAASASGTISTATASPTTTSWAWCGTARSGAIDFFVDRDIDGRVFLNPVRFGTGVEYYANVAGGGPHQHRFRGGPGLSDDRDRGAARVRLRLRDGWRGRLPAVWRAAGDPRGSRPSSSSTGRSRPIRAIPSCW